jgi:DNA polymerase-3 subunit gamma/tau
VLTDLAEVVHAVTRAKVAGGTAGDAYSAEENARAATLGARLSIAILARAWQMLLKGIEETARAGNPLAAAEMVLVRLAYTADLPAPDEIIRTLGGASVSAGTARNERPPAADRPVLNAAPEPVTAVAATASDAGPQMPRTFEDVVALAAARRDAKLMVELEEHVSLVRFEPGHLEIHLLDGAPSGLAGELSEKLSKWTGRRWVVVLGRGPGQTPLGIVKREREAAERAELEKHPAVRAILDAFPESRITAVRPLQRPPEDETGTG